MKKTTIHALALMTAMTMAATAQDSSSTAANSGASGGISSDSSSVSAKTDTGAGAYGSQSPGSHLSATGRSSWSSGSEIRGSTLMGAQVRTSNGDSLGTVSDVILNPTSGHIDFAVLSLDTSARANTASPGAAATSQTQTSGQLVAVPWTLLRSSGGMAGATSSSTTSGLTTSATSGSQPMFTYTGDRSKLNSAPTFDQNNWPDLAHNEWRHSVFSHYGVQPGSYTGGSAYTPGGSSSGSSYQRGTSGIQRPGAANPNSSSSGTLNNGVNSSTSSSTTSPNSSSGSIP